MRKHWDAVRFFFGTLPVYVGWLDPVSSRPLGQSVTPAIGRPVSHANAGISRPPSRYCHSAIHKNSVCHTTSLYNSWLCAILRISRKPPRPPRPPSPSTLDPRPSTLDFTFFIVFFYSLFIKFGKQYQVNVGSPSAGLTLAESLMYIILDRGTIRNICGHLIRRIHV